MRHAPFGRPVVPLVWMIHAVSSGSAAGAVRAAGAWQRGWCGRRCRRRRLGRERREFGDSAIAERGGKPVEMVGRGEHGHRIHVVDQRPEFVRGEARVAEHHDHADGRRRVHRNHDVGVVVGHDRDPLAGRCDGGDPPGSRDDSGIEFGEAPDSVAPHQRRCPRPHRRRVRDHLVQQHSAILHHDRHRSGCLARGSDARIMMYTFAHADDC